MKRPGYLEVLPDHCVFTSSCRGPHLDSAIMCAPRMWRRACVHMDMGNRDPKRRQMALTYQSWLCPGNYSYHFSYTSCCVRDGSCLAVSTHLLSPMADPTQQAGQDEPCRAQNVQWCVPEHCYPFSFFCHRTKRSGTRAFSRKLQSPPYTREGDLCSSISVCI